MKKQDKQLPARGNMQAASEGFREKAGGVGR